jgi:hypothetical protein
MVYPSSLLVWVADQHATTIPIKQAEIHFFIALLS